MTVALEHSQARELCSLSADEPLTADQERDLAVHLVGCPACKSYYEGLQQAREAFSEVAGPAADAFALDRAVHRAVTVLGGGADPGPLARPGPDAIDAPVYPDIVPLDEDEVTVPAEPATAPAGETVRIRTGEPTMPIAEPPAATPFDDPGPVKIPRRERRAIKRDARGGRSPVAVLVAILLVVALGGAAVWVVTQQPQVAERLRGGSVTPAVLKQRVSRAFDGMRSLEAGYRIVRLGLYRPEPNRTVFASATERGRVVYQAPGSLREERTLEIPNVGSTTTTTVRTEREVKTLVRDRNGGTVRIATNTPFGPPDGSLQSRFGVLEEGVGTVARMLSVAGDLDVVRRSSFDDRDVWVARFTVEPNAFTRADRIQVHVDAETFLPLRVERSIGRSDALVLGAGDLLTPDAVAAAFGDRPRVTTEVVELDRVKLDDVVLPGEFVITPPPGAEQDHDDMGFERVGRAELLGRLDFTWLAPSSLPPGFREDDEAVMFIGTRAASVANIGAPEAIAQTRYDDGTTTVVLSERIFDRRRDLNSSPLETPGGLPVSTRRIVMSGREMTYAISPELPPHVYGWLDDVLVLAVGYASEEDLAKIVSAVGREEAARSPSPSGSPDASTSGSPGASPSGSPGASPSGSPGASPSPSP